MSVVHLILNTLGFDPSRMAGQPATYEFAYSMGLFLAVALGLSALATPLRLAPTVKRYCLWGILGGIVWVTAVQQLLLIEYPEKTHAVQSDGELEPNIVPIPLPGLRSREFDDWAVGTPNYRNATPSAYAAKGLEPENALATFATVALHWLGVMATVSCFVASGCLLFHAPIGRLFSRVLSRFRASKTDR